MIHDNQGSPFVLFKKDYNKDCFWILFLRKGLGIRRGAGHAQYKFCELTHTKGEKD